MEDDDTRTCARCGQAASPAGSLGWSMGVEPDGRVRWHCETCARLHVRDIEAKLPDEFWG